jgi:ribosomal protein S18 acetylase RimI-like enzyme
MDRIRYRPAGKEDCRTIARLYSMASDGVTDYLWTLLVEPGQDILDAAEKRYSEDDSQFGYKNTTIAEINENIAGMLVAFPLEWAYNPETDGEPDPVLLPYTKLEQEGSYYICAMAVVDEYRGKGIGTEFLEIAKRQAIDKELLQLSLIVFEQNEGAKRLYERNGFYEVKREPVVPHELIRYTGDAILMVKDI